MSSSTPHTAVAVTAGAVAIVALAASPIGDQGTPLIVLLGPVVTGAIAANRQKRWKPVAAAWALAGVLMLVVDWIVNDEDQLFHGILTVLMVALTALGAAIGRRSTRRHRRSAIAATRG